MNRTPFWLHIHSSTPLTLFFLCLFAFHFAPLRVLSSLSDVHLSPFLCTYLGCRCQVLFTPGIWISETLVASGTEGGHQRIILTIVAHEKCSTGVSTHLLTKRLHSDPPIVPSSERRRSQQMACYLTLCSTMRQLRLRPYFS